ncbi:MAG: hypothetical protein HFH75_16755 [Lachnospiraceae bacterium]|jgi:hypothetical protein|nr:hypothetical protein [Lachnospiraceae bacterium]MDE6919415.1 hypothetical protein [Lachnospiraceae bacterium]MDE6939511.1 hypothetical protein [Lachnospiraceae bacterium]MDE7000186.1 hypothetical protein [Lachnospiraceae bacterium]
MLGKLLKYEWKGLFSPLLILLIVLGGTTALTCGVILTINPKYNETIAWYSAMALVFSIFLYYFGLIGCTLGTTLIIAVRFYKTCYTDQGYLTHTLPASATQILNAKIIASILAYLLMLLAIAATIFIIFEVGMHHAFSLMPDEQDELKRMLAREFSLMLSEFSDAFGISLGGYIAYLMLFCIIALFANIVTILGCVSLGQLYAKHRIVGAIVAYFIVQFVMQVINNICFIPMYTKMMIDGYNSDVLSPFGILSPTMNLSLFMAVALAVIMYFVNLHMMTKKLNLE